MYFYARLRFFTHEWSECVKWSNECIKTHWGAKKLQESKIHKSSVEFCFIEQDWKILHWKIVVYSRYFCKFTFYSLEWENFWFRAKRWIKKFSRVSNKFLFLSENVLLTSEASDQISHEGTKTLWICKNRLVYNVLFFSIILNLKINFFWWNDLKKKKKIMCTSLYWMMNIFIKKKF